MTTNNPHHNAPAAPSKPTATELLKNAFNDGIVLKSDSDTTVLVNYVDSCAVQMLKGHEAEFPVRSYLVDRIKSVLMPGNPTVSTEGDATETKVEEVPEEKGDDEEEKGDNEEKDPLSLEIIFPKNLDMSVKGETYTVKLGELSDAEKVFIKNRLQHTLHDLYEQFLKFGIEFNEMCKRSETLIKKMSTRKAMKCFAPSVSKKGEQSHLEVNVNNKNKTVVNNVAEWYCEFVEEYYRREKCFDTILKLVTHMKKIQERPEWEVCLGEKTFNWKDKLESFIPTSETSTELVSYLNGESSSDLPLLQNEKSTSSIKEAVLFHFFQVKPNIIVQLSIASNQSKDCLQ